MNGGNYRVTARWTAHDNAEPAWLLEVEHLDERPGFRTVHWSYKNELGDLGAFTREIAAGTPGRPPADSVDINVVVPDEIRTQLDHARQHGSAADVGPASLAKARRLRRDARMALAALGMSERDRQRVLDQLAPDHLVAVRARHGAVAEQDHREVSRVAGTLQSRLERVQEAYMNERGWAQGARTRALHKRLRTLRDRPNPDELVRARARAVREELDIRGELGP